ncbi:MAG: KamA family radical SAM protein [Bdellovibrionaceae bacterium]|nr:KamA family radical SAM protein [Pseudobdellovibrionaceae bacterium]
MKLQFKSLGKPESISEKDWFNWMWQVRNIQNFGNKKSNFSSGATPYYLKLATKAPILKPIVEISQKEFYVGRQSLKDPLGEEKHSPFSKLIHRYPDRVLFLVTDQCAVYCRYCTRKRFTGKKKGLSSKAEQAEILSYIKKNKGIREVILSGGDPLTLSDSILDNILKKLREISHVEIIRIASRMPVVCPMRLTDSLCHVLKKYQPVFLMTHFNHPLELTKEVQESLTRMADSGILLFNQTVLLNQINNNPSIIQALMRRLLYLRVKPYYMFQCDPSEGTDHFRTSIEDSLSIQKELWGRLSGLALPNLSLDIPGGGGKVGLVPDFALQKEKEQWHFKGWDFVEGSYKNPVRNHLKIATANETYQKEWELLTNQTYGKKNSQTKKFN